MRKCGPGRMLIEGLPVLGAQEETRKLAQYTDYRMVSVVGGQSIEEQGFKLRKVPRPALPLFCTVTCCMHRQPLRMFIAPLPPAARGML